MSTFSHRKKPPITSTRRTRFELLEQRLFLAGDTYLINFQHDEASVPTRYLRDIGETFGLRTGGLSYGWTTDHTDQSRERSLSPDQRLDTLIHIEAGARWEMALPNGSYSVEVGVGDPANNDGVHTINVEGINLHNAVPDGNAAISATGQVIVSDGRLTLDSGSAANKATRINYIHIVSVSTGGNTAPAVPTITEPAISGQIVSPADVHMEAIGFVDSDGNEHKSTDWSIWTLGPGAEPVWQTLGIEGVERLHTHLGDGIFLNSRAGETQLAGSTNYELRVRFRDDAGSVSSYATRQFQTAASSTVFPLEIEGVSSSVAPLWQTLGGSDVDLPSASALLSPSDPIIAIDIDGNSSSPDNERAENAINGTLAKYLNFGESGSGFIVTPAAGATVLQSFQMTTANDAVERDPTGWQLFGTNDAISSANHSRGDGEEWTLIDSGAISLPSARNAIGPLVPVDNVVAYSSYRMVFTGVKDASAANSMQIAEVQFFGDLGVTPSPATIRLESAGGDPLLEIAGSSVTGNSVTYFPSLENHADVRVVVQAGSAGLGLEQTDLTISDEHGSTHTIFLPAIALAAGERLDLWVANSGATYFGNEFQNEPDFSLIARSADLSVPFIAMLPGFVIEEVGVDYRLPVNIAFVPNPGPNPDDPLYYVTELYGSIQVVTRDGTKHEFASGLLDYNPQGPISGSGEQGLSGITVVRDQADPDIYHLYVGMLWDNGSPTGGASHYPKVERIDSVAGGLTMGSRTVLLNMQPETQGQSHQISNISIGPDGKLYVHNGDGFDASTAQNLNSFRGKVLRMNLDGSAPTDNPFYNAADGISARDYVFAYGLRNPFGGAWRSSDGKHYSVENGPSVDRLAQINAGVNYGWNGSNASMLVHALYNWNPSHAPVNITFVQESTFSGSAFPAELMDVAFVSESGPTYAEGPQAEGKRIVGFQLDASGNVIGSPTTLVEYVGTGRASVVGLAAGPDGLYFSELYEDTGANGPTASGARIFRVRYVSGEPGDFDLDGVTDGSDLSRWQSGYGITTTATVSVGDADGDRDVDGRDFLIWQRAYSNGTAVTQETISAGEPSAALRETDQQSSPLSSTGQLINVPSALSLHNSADLAALGQEMRSRPMTRAQTFELLAEGALDLGLDLHTYDLELSAARRHARAESNRVAVERRPGYDPDLVFEQVGWSMSAAIESVAVHKE